VGIGCYGYDQSICANQETGKVMSSHAMESRTQVLSGIVGIDVLNVINLGDHSNACSEIDRTVSDSHSRAAAPAPSHCLCRERHRLPGEAESRAMCLLSAFSSTKSVVLPVRSRQISTGICSSDNRVSMPFRHACEGARVMPCFLPLNDSRKNVSSASAMPTRLKAFC